MDDLKSAAFHEAGHAVVAQYYGINPHALHIGTSERAESDGYMVSPEYFVYLPAPWAAIGAMRVARVAVAGALAQVRGTGRRWVPWFSVSDEESFRRAAEVMGGDLGLVLHFAVEDVRRVFRRAGVWPAVESLAELLIERRTLDRETISLALEHLPDHMGCRTDSVYREVMRANGTK